MLRGMNRLRMLRAAARRKRPTPLGALWRGLVAGAIGAGAQSLFFMATKRWAPRPTELPPGAAKPEPQAQKESGLETVARRFVEGFMQRGPLSPEQKKRLAGAAHHAFGAMWGGLYGLWRESYRVSPILFGALVWMASDNFILPLFRVAAWPHRYSLREHHYALHANIVYGLGTAAAYAVLRDVGPGPLAGIPAVVALQAAAWALRTPPARLLQRTQSWSQRFIFTPLMQKAALA